MIRYAVSFGSFGENVTPELADAFRKSKFRNTELSFRPLIEQGDGAANTSKLLRELVREGAVRSSSVHLPFFGNNLCWDPSALDEEMRKDVSSRFAKLILDNADLMAPLATLHASNEPPLEEHPKRIDQVCRTIEELLPVAEKLNFSINIEYLPRLCVGRSVDELQKIVSRFDAKHVGICMDVNHTMNLWRSLPDIVMELAPRIRSFHISDYDGVDELHWFPGQGIIDWPALMKSIRAIDHDVLLIFETVYQLQSPKQTHPVDPLYAIRENENAAWFLENCDRIVPELRKFKIPGND